MIFWLHFNPMRSDISLTTLTSESECISASDKVPKGLTTHSPEAATQELSFQERKPVRQYCQLVILKFICLTK